MDKQPHGFDLVVANMRDVPIKRLAWAFGCAKKNSDEEAALYRLLVEKIQKEGA